MAACCPRELGVSTILGLVYTHAALLGIPLQPSNLGHSSPPSGFPENTFRCHLRGHVGDLELSNSEEGSREEGWVWPRVKGVEVAGS